MPMHGRGPLRRPKGAADWRSGLSVLGVFVLAAVFALTKVAERLLGWRRWHDFGTRELVLLLGQAAVVALVVVVVLQRVQRQRAAAEQRRQQAEQRLAANAAVVRVAQTVARELAQPLSGVLSYSELLLQERAPLSADERYQVEGLREGVLQLEHLLQTLRAAVDDVPTDDPTRHLAEDVERCVTQPRPRALVQRTAR